MGIDRRERRGSALVLSLIAVVIVVLLAASFTRFASSIANRQAQSVFRKQAFYMAEAGLAEAFAGLLCGKSGNVGTPESPALFGSGIFWVTAEPLETDAVKLEAIGMVGSGQARLSVVARKGEKSVVSLGVFGDQALTLAPGTLIDAYDSSLGGYESQSDHTGAQLGSNATISLSGTAELPTVVVGSVTPGPDQAVTTVGQVTITGGTEPALELTPFPAVDQPEVELAAALVQGPPYPLVISAGQGGYESLTIQSGAQVLIQGPAVVVLGKLTVEPEAELVFDTTQGAIELYVTDALDLESGSLLTTTGTDPSQVAIQVPGQTEQPLRLRSASQFHGVFYAPEASVAVGGEFELFGALVADTLLFEGPARLHFDRNLGKVAAEAALPSFLSWRIVNLASSSTDLSMDPFSLLGLDRSLLEPPAEAHKDQWLKIDYFDKSGVYHTYSGWESAFLWSVVKDVISATRDGEAVLYPSSCTTKTGTAKQPGTIPIVDGPMI